MDTLTSDIRHVVITELLVSSRIRQESLAQLNRAKVALIGVRNPQGRNIKLQIESASCVVTVATGQST